MSSPCYSNQVVNPLNSTLPSLRYILVKICGWSLIDLQSSGMVWTEVWLQEWCQDWYGGVVIHGYSIRPINEAIDYDEVVSSSTWAKVYHNRLKVPGWSRVGDSGVGCVGHVGHGRHTILLKLRLLIMYAQHMCIVGGASFEFLSSCEAAINNQVQWAGPGLGQC